MKRVIRSSESIGGWEFDGWTYWGGKILKKSEDGYFALAEQMNVSDSNPDPDEYLYTFYDSNDEELSSVAERLTLEECDYEFQRDYKFYRKKSQYM